MMINSDDLHMVCDGKITYFDLKNGKGFKKCTTPTHLPTHPPRFSGSAPPPLPPWASVSIKYNIWNNTPFENSIFLIREGIKGSFLVHC